MLDLKDRKSYFFHNCVGIALTRTDIRPEALFFWGGHFRKGNPIGEFSMALLL